MGTANAGESKLPAVACLAVLLAVLPASACFAGDAQVPAGAEPAGEPAEEESGGGALGMGLAIDVSFASMYYFRGMNVFSEDEASDQNGFVGTTVTLDLSDTGLSISYWSAIQLIGDNRKNLIDDGAGAEQGVSLNLERDLAEGLTLSSYAFVYFYPLAEQQSGPFLDFSITLSQESLLTVSVQTAVFTTLSKYDQDQKYLYAAVALEKSAELAEGLEAGFSAALGYKIYMGLDSTTDNVHDVRVALTAGYEVSSFFSVGVSLNWAWSDLEERGIEDEQMFWAEVTLSLSL